MKKRVLTILLVLCIMLSFTSCTGILYDWIDLGDDTDAGEDDSTEENVENIYTGDVINNITENTVNITGDNSDITYASAAGLRSAASVYCAFERNIVSGYPWNPSTSAQQYYSSGSGVIYKLENDGSAFVITNFHVVYDSDSNSSNGISQKIYLYLYGLESDDYAIPATYVGGSAAYDIAVLRINANDVIKNGQQSGSVSAVTVGDSDKVVPGQTSIAIGNPSGLGISVTKGIVSVASEYITMTAPDDSGEMDYRVIRIDTPINSGNSGGGLFNGKGELIGIVNAKVNSTTVENIGYAIPSAVASAVADNIIDYCYGSSNADVMRAIIGITIAPYDVNTTYDTETGLITKTEMVKISAVTAGGLAANAGLEVGDTIKSVKVGNREVVNVTLSYHFIDAMLYARADDTVTVTYIDAVSGAQIAANIVITQDCLQAY